jgi:hypothetical protein
VRPRTVLLVGNPALPLKGFPTAVAALSAAAAALPAPLRVRWVCQQRPSAATVPNLAGSGLDIELVVAPAQEDLPALYRGHDAFLFTSRRAAGRAAPRRSPPTRRGGGPGAGAALSPGRAHPGAPL